MVVRLQEVHPPAVHFPLALLPVAIGVDLVGRVIGSVGLRETARHLMPVVAGAAAVAAVTGMTATEEPGAEGRAHDILVTHQAINLTVAGAAAAMASWRWRRSTPSSTYLGVGLAAIGLATYSAYLRSRTAHEDAVGAGVAEGDRVVGRRSAFRRGHAAAAVRTAAGDMLRGLPRAAADIVRGEFAAPTMGDPEGRGGLHGPTEVIP